MKCKALLSWKKERKVMAHRGSMNQPHKFAKVYNFDHFAFYKYQELFYFHNQKYYILHFSIAVL